MTDFPTGALIARLRAERGLTQSELADQLQVTHQAVSKWERGESLPDVALLIPLARFFNMTVDDLLSGVEPEPTQAPAPKSPRWRFLRASEPNLADASSDQAAVVPPAPAAPAARPAAPVPAVPAAPARFQETGARRPEGSRPTLEQVMELAAFVDSDVLERLMASAIASGPVSWKVVTELAPFLSSESLERLLSQVENLPDSPELVIELAPFLDGPSLSALVERLGLAALSDWELTQALAPFLPQEQLEAILAEALNGLEGAEPGRDGDPSGR